MVICKHLDVTFGLLDIYKFDLKLILFLIK